MSHLGAAYRAQASRSSRPGPRLSSVQPLPSRWDSRDSGWVTPILTSWRDPLLETQDPYGHPESRVDAPPARHVQNRATTPLTTIQKPTADTP